MAREKSRRKANTLADLYGRSGFVRRQFDITQTILADRGGADQCSETGRQLIRRFAAGAALAEQMEVQLARGEIFNAKDFAALCSSMVEMARFLGIEKVTTNSKSPLMDYLNSKAQSEDDK